MLRNIGGNGTEPTMLAYQLKEGMKEIGNVMKISTKERGNSSLFLKHPVVYCYTCYILHVLYIKYCATKFYLLMASYINMANEIFQSIRPCRYFICCPNI
jgi:hypothetical protein